jgi:hypothetical protein
VGSRMVGGGAALALEWVAGGGGWAARDMGSCAVGGGAALVPKEVGSGGGLVVRGDGGKGAEIEGAVSV